jgi:general secretion pathway protein C
VLQKAKKLFSCNLKNLLFPVILLLGIMASAFYIKNIYFLYTLKESSDRSYIGKNLPLEPIDFQGRLARKPSTEVPVVASQDEVPLQGIILTGIIASNQPERSLAIVLEKGEQHTYRKGDTLSSVPEGMISDIGVNSIKIKGRDKHYTLILVERTDTPSVENVNNKLMPTNSEYGWDDYIISNPVYEKGKLIGLRLMPGKQKMRFTHYGLRPGDIVVKIDDYDLTDPAQLEQARLSWQQAFAVQLVIIRNNQKTLFNLRLNNINEKLINNHAQE